MLKKLLDVTFWKFILVGIANTIVGTAVMFICYNVFGLSYWFSSASNYIVGSILSYFLNKYFTFKNKEKSIKIVVKFVINITICYAIGYGAAIPIAKSILSGADKNIQENVAMLFGMGLFVILNYIGQRFFAFKKED